MLRKHPRKLRRQPSPPTITLTAPPKDPDLETAEPTEASAAAAAAATAESTQSSASIEAFQPDLFTGAASAQIPLLVPAGTAAVTPNLVLRYNSRSVDDLDSDTQGQWTGLGWTLDTGGFIIRDSKGTIDKTDDSFTLVFGDESHKLVAGSNGRYRTKDETFWLIK